MGPEAVSRDESSYYKVDYLCLVALLLEAIQELHRNIQDVIEKQDIGNTSYLESKLMLLRLQAKGAIEEGNDMSYDVSEALADMYVLGNNSDSAIDGSVNNNIYSNNGDIKILASRSQISQK